LEFELTLKRSEETLDSSTDQNLTSLRSKQLSFDAAITLTFNMLSEFIALAKYGTVPTLPLLALFVLPLNRRTN
jgi:hypothetical protein